MRTNSCTKPSPLFAKRLTFPGGPCVNKARPSPPAYPCSSASVTPRAPRRSMGCLCSASYPFCPLLPSLGAQNSSHYCPGVSRFQCLPPHSGVFFSASKHAHIVKMTFPFFFFSSQVFQMNICWILTTHSILNCFSAGFPLTTLLKCFLQRSLSSIAIVFATPHSTRPLFFWSSYPTSPSGKLLPFPLSTQAAPLAQG